MFETDDDDFMPSSSGNLSSIFNSSVLSDDNANLSYKAPKQPKILGGASAADSEQKNSDSKVSTQLQSSVIVAKVINLWKLNNGQNRLLGKHIVAIIGNAGQHYYEMIVYKEKTNIIIRQPLNESLILYKYPKNFIGIFDSNKQFWNLNFDSLENLESFLNQISTQNCQIIEQKSQNCSNDQVGDQVDNKKNFTEPELQPVKDNDTDIVVNEPSHNTDNNSKDKILSRIIKVGQQIFPKSAIEGKTSTELSDSETDSNYSESKPPKPTTVPRKFRRNPSHEKALMTPIMTENKILQNSYTPSGGQMFPNNNNQMVLNPHSMVYTQPYPDYGVNNFIIAQNAELKANLAEINLKLATVLGSQGENVDKNGNKQECDNLKSRIKCLNLKIENLQSDLQRMNESFGDLKRKYDLKCLEMIKQQEKEANFKSIMEEVNRLKEELNDVETLRTMNKELNISIEAREKLIETQWLSLKEYEDKYLESQQARQNLEKDVSELNLKIEELTLKTKDYEKKLEEKENNPVEPQKNDLVLQKDVLTKKIKESMNEAFRGIMENFDENVQYNFSDIQEVVLENLKKTSYSLINIIQ